MSKRPALSKGETEIARAVWGLGEATVSQVFKSFPKRRKIDYATVQTYLRRLEAKGYLRARREGRAKVYTARVAPTQVIRETIDDLLNRLFGGEVLPLMHHLVQDRKVSKKDLDDLRAMLIRYEADDHER